MPLQRRLCVALVATCPPRQCGIATFTRDLADTVKAADPRVRVSWVAINEPDAIHPYGPEVRWRIRQRTSGPYGWMASGSLMATQETRTRGSAALTVSAKSRVKVAMPHCRGGQVATNATHRRRCSGIVPVPGAAVSARDRGGVWPRMRRPGLSAPRRVHG